MTVPWQMIPRYHPQVSPVGILRAAFAQPSGPHTWDRGDHIARQGEDLFALNGATAGLIVALRALDLPPGSGVAVPIYTCVTVFEAIRQAGHRCVFVDVDPQTFRYDLEHLAARRDEIAAAILVHTFGYDGDFDAVAGVLPGRPIIEDCSHALGSSDGSRALGARGAAAVFSFNFQKPVSVGGGGWLVVNDPDLSPAVCRQVEALGPPPSRLPKGELRRRVVKAALYRRPWYGLLLACGALKADRPGRLRDIHVARMSHLEEVLVERGLAGVGDRFQRCRAWAGRLTQSAGALAPACHFVAAGENWNGYLWPVVLDSPAQRERMVAYFHRCGVDAFLLWLECLDAARQYGYRGGACPRLESALPRLMMLPCYAELNEDQQERILQAIRQSPLKG